MFRGKDILFTNSGRSSLQAIIEDFNLKNSEMAVQSFICSDFFSPFLLQNNIRPVLLDSSNKSLNVSLSEIKKKYKQNKKIKSVLIVHTLGLANKEIEQISKWCRTKGIILIEDCVYFIGVKYNGRYLGTFGDAAVFSFFKSLNIFVGSAYLRNKGKIRVVTKKYKLNKLDLLRFFLMLKISDKLLRMLSPIKKSLDIKIAPIKTEILSFPGYANFFYVSSERIDADKRREVSKYLFNLLKKEIKNKKVFHSMKESETFSYSIPLFVKNKEKVYRELTNLGVLSNKRWDSSLDLDPSLKARWFLDRTPNARRISFKIINILIDPKWNETYIKGLSKKISAVILKFGI